jgi:hypothetical protein
MKLKVLIPAIFAAMAGCEDRSVEHTCEVRYQIDTIGTYQLTRTWKLIGIQQNNGDIDYPPCPEYTSGKKIEVTASFSDTVHNLAKHPYKYPHLVTGQGPVNGYSTSYKTEDSGRITIDPVISTLMGSPSETGKYEGRYFATLPQTTRFEITHNLLTLFDDAGNKLLFVAQE